MYARAVRIQFIASRLSSSSLLASRSNPSSTFLVTLIAIRSRAIIIGKLKTAMRMLLLLAFDAIPEMRLSAAENPNDDSTSVRIKSAGSFTGLLIKSEKRTKPVRESTRQSSVL